MINRLQRNDVVVFVGAHPDDETTIGPLLACAADRCREVVVVSLTRGESGWNLAAEDLTQTLAEVRQKEFTTSVGMLHCTPVTFGYINGVSKAHPKGLAMRDLEETAVRRWHTSGSSQQTADGVYARWTAEAGDPADRVLDLLRQKRATVVIALDPDKGYTNHKEHLAATRAALGAVRTCNETSAPPIAFYYAYNPSDDVEGAERIATADLIEAGGKDYGAIAREAWACYESQFGPGGSERSVGSIGQGIQQCLLQAADVR